TIRLACTGVPSPFSWNNGLGFAATAMYYTSLLLFINQDQLALSVLADILHVDGNNDLAGRLSPADSTNTIHFALQGSRIQSIFGIDAVVHSDVERSDFLSLIELEVVPMHQVDQIIQHAGDQEGVVELSLIGSKL